MNFEEKRISYINTCEKSLEKICDSLFMKDSEVSKAAIYSLMNGGKRVRGTLTLAVCEMLGGNMQVAENFAAAIEMVHASSLIHDDLPCMDDDDVRRGKPSCHIAFGETTALLAGDMLLIQAFEAIADANCSAQNISAAVKQLSIGSGSKGMIYGQELDLANENKPIDEKLLNKIHKHKTGALIKTAAKLGIIAAGFSPEQTPEILTYADNIGIVFQIIDDVLDVISTEETLGKPVGSDKTQGKTTYAVLFGVEEAKNIANNYTSEAIDNIQNVYGDEALFLADYAKNLVERLY